MIYDMKTSKLQDYGIENPIRSVKNMKENIIYEEAKETDIIKFEKSGDYLEGEYLDFEESRQYPGSFIIKVNTDTGLKGVFVSGIVIDKIRNNMIKQGVLIKIEYLGKKKTQDNKREYNDYKLYFAR